MITHGQAPYLECSSKGDSRFSAFYARIRGRGNRSIEELYQGSKTLPGGVTGLSWREAKGKKAENMDAVTALYAQLWNEFIAENPALLSVLTQASGLSDRFGQPGHCCQATELWRIRSEALGTKATPNPKENTPAQAGLMFESEFETTRAPHASAGLRTSMRR